ncbi:MAG TPA: class I tRNA ligase family protein, partial [Alphaproteobacteria bacterium]|nr:class I tRNA ligase family protein [Alphaproteobacteria bacterium]
RYGADSARLFMLSDSPPERDLEWTEAGIEGVWRYVQRLWRMVTEPATALPVAGSAMPDNLDAAGLEFKLRRIIHFTIAAVSDDIERFRFNRAIAHIRALSNAIAAYEPAGPHAGAVLREALETLVLLVAPMMPHFAEEAWRRLGHDGYICREPWPEADPALVAAERVVVAVQVNGKKRATLELAPNADRASVEAEALAEPKVAAAIAGKDVRKVIVVPNRIVNVVV